MMFNDQKAILLTVFLTFHLLVLGLQGQERFEHFKIPPLIEADAPSWVHLMYADRPNINEVEMAYQMYYKTNPFIKSIHTQNYKHWMRWIENSQLVDESGYVLIPNHEEEAQKRKDKMVAWQAQQGARQSAGNWQPIGPFETFDRNDGNTPRSSQLNVYTIDQSASNPDVLYAGSETASVYKSIDGGAQWTCVTDQLVLDRAVHTVKIHPTNPDIVLFGTHSEIYRSTDGGVSWSLIISASNMRPNDILFVPGSTPSDPHVVLVTSINGLYRSTNDGASFNQTLTAPCWDLELKPGSNSIVYLLQTDPTEEEIYFYRSMDKGSVFTKHNSGWFAGSSSNINNSLSGARMAVTEADPEYIYVALLGDDVSRAQDLNWIGVYKSINGGTSWSLPAGDPGGPYSSSHYCLSHFHPYNIGSSYNQGYYNLGIAVSDTDKDKILVGCLNLFQSTDGAASYKGIGGYINEVGYQGYRHPDIQEIEINGNDVWVASDGGIDKYSADWVTHTATNRGMNGTEYWGFDVGWNEDFVVGGRYHNGNSIYSSSFPAGEMRAAGGGERATGYIEKARNHNLHFSDTRDVYMPDEINAPLNRVGNLGMYPTENYLRPQKTGDFEQHPIVFNRYFLTRENKLYKSENSGKTFEHTYTFGSDANHTASFIEISRSNPNVMYVAQHTSSGAKLWYSNDAGNTFTSKALPSGMISNRGIFISLSAVNENHIFIANAQSHNSPHKVFESLDGGASWTNLTTSALDNETPQYLLHQMGTDRGLYLVTTSKIFYRNASHADWNLYTMGLPAKFHGEIARPFYRDNELRVASRNRGIWSSTLFESSQPLAQPVISADYITCPNNLVQLEDYSVLDHDLATWHWSINPAPAWIQDTSMRNPTVVFGAVGSYDVTLTISQQGVNSSKTITVNVDSVNCGSCTNNYHTTSKAEIVDSSCCVVLTPPTNWVDGAVWNKQRISLNESFMLSFDLDLGDMSTSVADGATFILQNLNESVIGDAGGALGANIIPSFSVAFRTYIFDRIEYWKNGEYIANSNTFPISGSGLHPVVITWNANTKVMDVDWNNDGVDLSLNYDIADEVFGGNPNDILWGFSAANGGLNAEHRVCNIQITRCPSNYAGVNSLTGQQITSATFETDGQISSDQIISGNTTNVSYDAGTTVDLTNGFQVLLGSTFEAFIDGCGNN